MIYIDVDGYEMCSAIMSDFIEMDSVAAEFCGRSGKRDMSLVGNYSQAWNGRPLRA
jgi:hypothetical protein